MLKNKYLFLAILLIAATAVAIIYHYERLSWKPINVVAVYNTDMTDASYQKYNNLIEEEFRKHGYSANLLPVYLQEGKLPFNIANRRIIDIHERLQKEGENIDLVIAQSDMPYNVVLENRHLSKTPIVGSDLMFSEYSDPKQQQKFLNMKSRHTYLAELYDTLDIQPIIDLGNCIFPRKHRFVACVDPTISPIDAEMKHKLSQQMASLPDMRYIDNIDLRHSPNQIWQMQKRILFQTLSIIDPESNQINNEEGGIFPVTWTFNSNTYFFHALMVKHDYATRIITENAETAPFITTTANDFLVSDSCIGGYFVPANVQVQKAVEAGITLMSMAEEGEMPKAKGEPCVTAYLPKEFHINWDIIRESPGCQYTRLSKFPDFVNIHNLRIYEEFPKGTVFIQILLVLAGISLLSIICVMFIHQARSKDARLQQEDKAAQNAIHLRTLAERILSSVNAKLWNEDQHPFDEPRFHVNDFFRLRLNKFLAINEPGSYDMQCLASIDQNEPHWYEIRMKVVADGDIRLKRGGMYINIDKQKEMEKENLESSRMLSVARERETFLESMNHQIRTPLNAIVGFSQVLGTPDILLSEEELKEYSDIIEDNNVNLMKCINDMLTITLIENSNTKFMLSDIKVKELISNYKGWDGIEHIISTHQNKIVIQPGDETDEINADPVMLMRVMTDLISNASKFSDPGSTIILGWKPSEEFTDSTTLFVKDEGIGIAPEYFRLIFDRFYRIDPFIQGAGLGLTLAKSLVENMGGHITLESEPQKGSTFKVHFRRIAMMLLCALTLSFASCNKTETSPTLPHSDAQKEVVVLAPFPQFGQACHSFESAIKSKFKDSHRYNLRFYYSCTESYDSISSDEKDIRLLQEDIDSCNTLPHKPDLFIIYGDRIAQAAAQLKDSLLDTRPVICMGVTAPNYKNRISAHPNYTVLELRPGIKENIDFIRAIGNRTHLITSLDNDFVDARIREIAKEQYPEGLEDFDFKYNFTNYKYSSHHTYLRLKYNGLSEKAIDHAIGMFYIATPERFNLKMRGIIANCAGGYFTPFPVMAEEVKNIADSILFANVAPKDIPWQLHKREYWIDWTVAKKLHPYASEFPENVHFVNLPWYDKTANLHRIHDIWVPLANLRYNAILLLSIILVLLLLASIIGILLYQKIRYRKSLLNLGTQARDAHTAIDAVTDATQSYFWIIDADNKVHMRDNAYPRLQLRRRPIDLSIIMRCFPPAQRRLISQSLRNESFESSTELEVTLRLPNSGMTHDVIIKIAPKEKTDEFKALGLIIFNDKVAQARHEREEAMRVTEDTKMKESFLASMGHEIRNPLNTIMGFSRLLAEQHYELTNDEREMFINMIIESNDHLLSLLDRVFTQTKTTENQQMELELSRKDVKSLMDELYMIHTVIVPQHLTFNYETGPEDLIVMCNRSAMLQVISNFMNNAIKFTPSGSITLGWEAKDKYVLLYVEDTGIGITEENRENIFKKFYKEDSHSAGAGIGLPLCKRLVDTMNGEIIVEKARKGTGSRFSVKLKTCD